MRKLINLNTKELKKVWKNNDKLEQEINEKYQEDNMFYIEELLACLKDSLSDWSIGFYNRNYIKIKNNEKFIKGIKQLQNDYGFFKREYYNKTIKREIKDLNIIDLKSEVVGTFNQYTKMPKNNIMIDYFIEQVKSNTHFYEDYEVDEDYNCYKTIVHTMSY